MGQTLTAGVSAIADDADGLPEVSTFTWQWLRASGGIDTAISGATSQTYTVAAADAGKKFKVTVSFTDLDGHPEALTSVAYPADRQVSANAAPTGSDKTVTLAEDGSYTFKAADFGFTDSDTGDALASVKIVTPPTAGKGTLKLDTTAVTANGSVTKAALDAGDLVYEPPANANGSAFASFTFKVSDGTAESASSYTMTVDVSAVNDAPTGSNKTVTTAEDTAYALKAADFGFADVDTDDALASVKITALPGTGKGTLTLDGRAVTANGSVTKAQLDAGNLVNTPPANANGTGYASFAFKVSDGAAESASAYTMTVDVTAANAAPTGSDKTVTLAEDGSYTFKAADFGFTDSDTGDALASVKIVTPPTAGKGTLKLDTTAVTANGSVTKAALDAGDLVYEPPANANGDDYASFAFKVSDGTAESAASYTMTLDVTAVNDPATGLPTISGTARVGQTLTAGVSAIADDADGLPEVSTFTWQWLRASGGTDTAISGATSQTYTVAAADAGKKFKVTVSFTDLDGHPEALTSVAYPADRQVSANAAPTGSDKTVTLAEDGSYTFKAADFGFTDTDTGDALASVKIVTPPTAGKGTLKLDTTAVTANGSVTKAALDAGDLVYEPPANANGDDYASFAFKVSDGTAESAASYTMTLDVTAVNDPATGLPTISGTARVGQTLTAGVSAIADDADGLPEVSTFTWQWLRASGGIDTAISGATSQTYTVAAADAGKKFKVTVSFTDLDGHPEALTSVAYPADRQVSANAAPTFGSASVTRSVEETMGDSTVSTATDVGAAVTATDTDDDTLTYSLEGTDVAKFTIEAGSGQIRTKVGERYDRETKASYSVTVKAADGNGGEDSVSVVINVTNRNEAPLAPEAPTVEASAGRSSNLDVSWTAPANSGRPEIEHYDLRYRAANSSDWSNGPQKITGTEGAIRGVVGGAEYEVQVRAANAEGNGAWSRSGRATTVRTSIIADGTLRLVDGTMPREGRLEIFHDGEWGTICDDYFDATEADLSCRLLGYDGAVEDWGRYRTGYFGPGTGPIVLDNLGCTGKESGLLQCPRHGGLAVREHNCRHTEDVSLRCGMAPRLVDIELSSSPGTDGRYDAGETIELTLVWSKAVVIETLAGYWPPKVWLFYEGDPGPGIGWRELLSPSYVRGSGTARTVFAVTLYSDGGSESSHWASFDTLRAEGNSLKLRSGSSIRSLDDGIDAQLGHDEYRWELQRQSLQVAAPAVAGLPEVSDPGADGAFAAGDRIEARVVFDAPVTVDGTGGTPTLGIALGGVRREASYESGSGTGTLTFALTVSDADGGAGAAKAVSNGIRLNGGTIGSADGLPAVLDFGSAPGVVQIGIAPASSGDDGTWSAGEAIEVEVAFAEPVEVGTAGGRPSVGMTLSGDAARQAAYARGSGTDLLTFSYTLGEADGTVSDVLVSPDCC